MPTNPKFDESIISPWKHVDDDSMEEETGNLPSFTEIFAQRHHQESSSSSSLYTLSPSSSLTSEFSHDFHPPSDDDCRKLHLIHTRSDSLSSCNSEVCNDVVEDADNPIKGCDQEEEEEEEIYHHHHARRESRRHWKRWRSRRKFGGFPPPISCIGISGEPWVWLQSTRQDGRFILREVRIPTQELMHGYRQNGCLKVDIVQSDEEEEKEKGKR